MEAGVTQTISRFQITVFVLLIPCFRRVGLGGNSVSAWRLAVQKQYLLNLRSLCFWLVRIIPATLSFMLMTVVAEPILGIISIHDTRGPFRRYATGTTRNEVPRPVRIICSSSAPTR